MSVMPSPSEQLRVLETQRLRDERDCLRAERDCLRAAVEYYARPITAATGGRSVFIDVGGCARTALWRAAIIRGEVPADEQVRQARARGAGADAI
jgi:hypothetical protein